jgi:hypothetical protein
MTLRCVVVLAQGAAPAPGAALPGAVVPPARVDAVWKQQRVHFTYQGTTVRYSCDGLRDKVRAMLLDLGARRDLQVQAVNCNDGRPPLDAQQPSLDVAFFSLAPVDAAAKPAAAGDLAPTQASYRPFTIGNDAFRNMNQGDCELVQEFVRQILPRLATRALKTNISCAAYRSSDDRYRVHGEVLEAVPVKDS